MEKKYSNKKLQDLAEYDDPIWPKRDQYYRDLLKKSIEAKGWKYSQLNANDQEPDVVHEQLWWDVCDMVHELAQLVLDERKKKERYVKEVKKELKDVISAVSSKQFTKYW